MSLDELENTLIEESIFRFFSNPKINFPAGDIEQVAIQDEEGKRIFQIITNFLGLQGASGPLPGSILDEIAESSYDNECIQSLKMRNKETNRDLAEFFGNKWDGFR